VCYCLSSHLISEFPFLIFCPLIALPVGKKRHGFVLENPCYVLIDNRQGVSLLNPELGGDNNMLPDKTETASGQSKLLEEV